MSEDRSASFITTSAGTPSGTDSSGTDSSGTDSSGTDSSGTDSSGTDSSTTLAGPSVTRWLAGTVAELGAAGAVLLALDPTGRTLELVAWCGYTDDQVAAWQRIAMDMPTPLTDAVRSGAAIAVGTESDFGERYPGFSRARQTGQSLVALPVRTPSGVCVGVLGLGFADADALRVAPAGLAGLAGLGRRAFSALEAAGVLAGGTAAIRHRPALTATRLQALTADLSASLTPEKILDVMTDHGRAVIGADMVQISLLSPDRRTFRLLRSRGVRQEAHEQFRTFSADAALPASDVLRTGVAVVFHRDEGTDRFPALAGLDVPQESFAVLPLHSEDRTVGVITFGWLVRQEFPPTQMGLALEVADLCAAALGRSNRYRREEEAREAAEAVTRRLRSLQNLTVRLAGAVEPADVADVLIHEAVDVVGAQAAVITEYDGLGTLTVLATSGLPDRALRRWRGSNLEQDRLAMDLVTERRPVLLRSRADRATRYPELTLDGVPQQTWFNMPLVAGGRVVGLAAFGWTQERELSDDEHEFLGAISAHTALALDRVALLRGARMTAETLQRALLPQVLVAVEGWEVATRYAPAVEGTQVGGDWYDAFRLPDGSVGLVLGDVMGKGLRAASGMGAVRSALRAYASADAEPGRVLAALDTYLATFADEDLVTCFYAVLDPDTGVLRYASAGHPPALVSAPGVPARWLESATSTPLGLAPPGGRTTATTTIGDAEVVHLFSDGLVEDRTRPLSTGLDLLAGAATDLAGEEDLTAALGALVDRMLAGRHNADDLAVLAMRRRRRTT